MSCILDVEGTCGNGKRFSFEAIRVLKKKPRRKIHRIKSSEDEWGFTPQFHPGHFEGELEECFGSLNYESNNIRGFRNPFLKATKQGKYQILMSSIFRAKIEGRKSRTGSGKAVESRGPSAAVSVETSTASGPAGPAEGRLSVSGPGGASDDTRPSGCFKCGKRGHYRGVRSAVFIFHWAVVI